MHECSRRQDYTLDSIPFNTLRYVPRLFEGFVALPEPFRTEEFYPFSQRFLLADKLRSSIESTQADYFERDLCEEHLLLLQLLLVIGEYVELYCTCTCPSVARALPGTEDLPAIDGDLF